MTSPLTRFWNARIGPGKVVAWNSGLVRLLAETKAALAPLGKTILYNGIAPAPHRTADRNRRLLSLTDGASNESFCLEGTNDPAARKRVLFTSIIEDATVMRQHPEKILLEFTNYQVDEGTINKVALGRY